jgi:hypothetical protein
MIKGPALLTFLSLISCIPVRGQDVRAASYELVHMNGLTRLNRLRLYVSTDLNMHRDSVWVFTGSHYTWLLLTESDPMGDGTVTLETFEQSTTYPGPALYGLQADVANRIVDVSNMSNSINSPLRITPWFILGPGMINSTPVAEGLQTNITPTPTGVVFAPVYTDPDGDSLAFALVDCFGENYFIPSGTSIDPTTGAITSDPPEPGSYAFCTRIEEYREGAVIGTTYTDAVVQIDHVAGVPSHHKPGAFGLFPNAIASGANAIVRCIDLSDLTIYDGSGRIIHHERVSNGALVNGATIPQGCYAYSLVDLSNGTRAGGRLIVY